MNEELIKQELQKYNMTDAAIAKLDADYMALAVKGVDDSVGYEIVKKARIDIKKRRVEVEKTRVQLKAESLEYGRRVDGEAKRITALLAPIEDHLIAQEKIVDDEKARIKAEAEAREVARIEARAEKLFGFGASLIGGNYSAYGLMIPAALVKACTDEQFAQFVAQVQEKKDAEDARLKAEEDARKAEAERLAKVAAEQEAERKRLAEISRKQAEEAARIKAEQAEAERVRLQAIAEEERKARIKERLEAEEREKKEAAIRAEAERVRKEKEEWQRIKDQEARDIAAAKQKVIDDARHAEEMEKARKEAAEKAKVEAEAKIKRDAEEKARKEEAAKIAAEKRAARQPDKVKLHEYVKAITAVAPPELKTGEAKDVLISFEKSLVSLLNDLRDQAEAL